MQKQWADGPLPLIESPRHILKAQGKKESTTATAATEMSHAHNLMIRGINSMLLQAPYISTPADIRDFVEYAHAFCIIVHDHHRTEEVLYFPLVEEASGVPGIMQKNVVQHEELMPKLHDFEVYAMQVMIGTKNYDSEKFVELINGFAPLLVQHLTDEIKVLMELEKFDIDWTPINKKMTQYATGKANKEYAMPFAIVNMDITYESNIHRDNWPPVPKVGLLIFRVFYVPKHKRAWRFGSCDVSGLPKELPFAPQVS